MMNLNFSCFTSFVNAESTLPNENFPSIDMANSTNADSSALAQLKASGTLVVADSGDLKKLAATGAHDATTNVRSIAQLPSCQFSVLSLVPR